MKKVKTASWMQASSWRGALFAFLLSASLLGRTAIAQNVYTSPQGFASYALGADGVLHAWGDDQYMHTIATGAAVQDSVPIVIPPPNGVAGWTDVATGYFFTIAIGTDGNVYSWGTNNFGQLGNGTTTSSNTPVEVQLPAGVTAKQVSAAWTHSLALGSDGNVYAWGGNQYGQLGDSTKGDTAKIPIKVKLPAGFTPVKVFASFYQSAALGSDGSLYTWGSNGFGQLALGNTTNQLLPVKVAFPSGVTQWKDINGGLYWTLALGDDGNLYSCGSNSQGQLGNGTTTNSTSFVLVNKPAGVTSWKTAGCAASTVLAIANNDSLYAWGYNGNGEMGNGLSGIGINKIPVATLLPSGVTAKSVSGGRNHALAVGSDNYYYAWGQGVYGQLGTDSLKNSSVPLRVYGVLQNPPSVPALTSPANNAVDQPTALTLAWTSATTEAGYQCQVSTDPTFATGIVANDSGLAVLADTLKSLGYSTKYYWRVRSYDNGVLGAYSVTDSFTTVMLPPGPTAQVWPASGATDQPAVDSLKCATATGATQYHWQVSTDLTFSTFVVNDSTMDTVNVVSNLTASTKYYWRVQAVNPGGVSSFAGPDSFTVMALPSVPVTAAPLNGANFERADTLTLMWQSAANAVAYGVQVSDTISFSRFVVNDSTTDTIQVVTKLNNLTKYYWRVLAYNFGGASVYSPIDSFTTRIAIPVTPGLVYPKLSTVSIPREATFQWRPASRADKYKIQVATNSQTYSSGDSMGYFKTALYDTTVADTFVTVSVPLQASTIYYWHVSAIDTAGMSGFSTTWEFKTGTGLTAVTEEGGVPKTFALNQNYPNPFNPTTVIGYSLPKAQMVSLRVYNVLGQVVATLVDGRQNAGHYEVNFNANLFSSGVYFYVLRTDNFTAMHKMMLLK